MKILIIRHFKVNYKWKAFCNSTEAEKAIIEYDHASIMDGGLRISSEYRVFSSTLPRAIETAQLMFGRNPDFMSDALNEVLVKPFITTRIKIPTFIWNIVGRIQWRFGSRRQPETYHESTTRITRFIDSLLCGNEDFIIVSHGWTIRLIIKHLHKKGFYGPKPDYVKNGQVLTFYN